MKTHLLNFASPPQGPFRQLSEYFTNCVPQTFMQRRINQSVNFKLLLGQHPLCIVDCIRAPPRRGRYWEIHPRCPKDFPRPERFPEGEARGKSRGSREISRAEGMDFPIPPEFWWSTDILLIINPSTGMDQEIHPSGQGRIDSVKINPSLLRMREWQIQVNLE